MITTIFSAIYSVFKAIPVLESWYIRFSDFYNETKNQENIAKRNEGIESGKKAETVDQMEDALEKIISGSGDGR